ncbi:MULTISPECIES: serine hydrolase [unclassified Wenzhouxiangella]|uniref:serine hydrolase domain-containing protein n=1 Tax=unclassified Wenzhouxiangella TaxID=2613841 RepID=UPI000E32663E|nr:MULTISPECIES: serine hydrolase [unclassified Wenzhouxiangella]RFF28555.1 class C beta-lactamase-related serine hydrolase [Wenzhouxiangella sp. 15181]RFP70075.1 class C beta-lactamase-related serine hydrolase [Wenzhouxiangella sp. 15190]
MSQPPNSLARILLLWGSLLAASVAIAETTYFPDPFDWQAAEPEAAGFDPEALESAVAFARDSAETEPGDLHQVLLDTYTDREPDYRVLGPTKPRAGDSGMILSEGHIVAQWGDVHRVDMTFSVVKSYLSTLAALAVERGLIESLHDPVGRYVTDGKFASEHNSEITWHHLLQQTSDWSGTLWDTPDWADRPVGDGPEQWRNREMHEPGTHFKYNDVRVNLLAYSLTQVFRKPLPVVLRETVMDPIGTSSTWRWHGYENSWVELDGLRMQSVSGGGHFGGGLFISTADHARYGLLMLNRGVWEGTRLIPDNWFEQLRQPTEARPDYGYMWWLNTDQERIPEAPENAYWAAGFGGNYIYVDECNDLVVVLRWIPELEAVIERILEAKESARQCRKAA